MREFKCLIVGDYISGQRRALLGASVSDQFPDGYIPTTVHNGVANAVIDGEPVNLTIWEPGLLFDEPNQRDQLMSVWYSSPDVFILLFSIADPASFENIRTRWCTEARRYAQYAPFILVGGQMHLRDCSATQSGLQIQGINMVTEEQGRQIAREIGAYEYRECSAETLDGVVESNS